MEALTTATHSLPTQSQTTLCPTNETAVTDHTYRAVASELIDAIGTDDFFNGRAEHDAEDYCCSLVATLIIYRDNERAITDIVPVWWEFHMVEADGEALTDFCWREFKEVFMSLL